MIPFYENHAEMLSIIRSLNLDFMPHLHAQLEILLVEKGKVENMVNGVSGVLNAGDISIMFPNNVHSYRTLKEGGESFCLIFIIDLALAADYTNTLLRSHPKAPFFKKDEIYKDVHYALKMLCEEYEYAKTHIMRNYICKAYTEIVVSRLLQKCELCENTDAALGDITYRTIHYINDNFLQPLTLADISKALGVGRYSLSRVFSDKIKVSFSDYVNTIRAFYAKKMLSDTQKSITEIAYDCGFQSIRTFNRIFKNIYKLSPRNYRKLDEKE